jgi:hypothetical protein
MKLSLTSDAKDQLLELAKSSELAAEQAAAFVARLNHIAQETSDDFLRVMHAVKISTLDGTEFFHVGQDNFNMILVRDPQRPDDLVVTKIYPDSQSADREKEVA